MTWTDEARAQWLAANREKRRAYIAKYNRKHRAKITAQTNAARKRKAAEDPKGYWLRCANAEARRRARALGIAWEPLLFLDCPDVCPVLGIKLDYQRWKGKRGWNPASPSIDRIDPKLGYVRGNVKVISNRANTLKRDGTVAEVSAVLKYMRRHS